MKRGLLIYFLGVSAACFSQSKTEMQSSSRSKMLSYAQKSEQVLFDNICRDLIQQSNYVALKQKLGGAHLISDPMTGRQMIKLPKKVDEVTLHEFNQYSPSDQLLIINAEKLPIYPLNDTLLVVDESKLFSDEIAFQSKHCYFKIIRRENGSKDQSKICIHAFGLRDEYLIITFSFNRNKSLLNYYFKLNASSLEVVKTSTINGDVSIE